jgi:hypothetical protein
VPAQEAAPENNEAPQAMDDGMEAMDGEMGDAMDMEADGMDGDMEDDMAGEMDMDMEMEAPIEEAKSDNYLTDNSK